MKAAQVSQSRKNATGCTSLSSSVWSGESHTPVVEDNLRVLLIIRKLITVFSATSTSRAATQANKPDRHEILSFLHFIYIPSSIITSRLILVAVIPTEWQSVSDTHSDKGSNVTQMLYSSSPNHDFRRRQNKQA